MPSHHPLPLTTVPWPHPSYHPLQVWHDRNGAGFGTQFAALSQRHLRLLVAHPALAWANLAASVCVGAACAWAFYHVDLSLKGGVLQRMGLLFILGAHSLLSGLASIATWRHERLLFIHERGVGCYRTLPYVLARTLVADAVPMRILPALAIVAIVYPYAGLDGLESFPSSLALYHHPLPSPFLSPLAGTPGSTASSPSTCTTSTSTLGSRRRACSWRRSASPISSPPPSSDASASCAPRRPPR